MSTTQEVDRRALTKRLLEFYGPERTAAAASGQSLVITKEMQERAAKHGFDRRKADAEAAKASTKE